MNDEQISCSKHKDLDNFSKYYMQLAPNINFQAKLNVSYIIHLIFVNVESALGSRENREYH